MTKSAAMANTNCKNAAYGKSPPEPLWISVTNPVETASQTASANGMSQKQQTSGRKKRFGLGLQDGRYCSFRSNCVIDMIHAAAAAAAVGVEYRN